MRFDSNKPTARQNEWREEKNSGGLFHSAYNTFLFGSAVGAAAATLLWNSNRTISVAANYNNFSYS